MPVQRPSAKTAEPKPPPPEQKPEPEQEPEKVTVNDPSDLDNVPWDDVPELAGKPLAEPEHGEGDRPGVWADVVMEFEGHGRLAVNVNYDEGQTVDAITMAEQLFNFRQGIELALETGYITLPKALRYSAARRAQDVNEDDEGAGTSRSSGRSGGGGGSGTNFFGYPLPGPNNLTGVIWWLDAEDKRWPIAPNGGRYPGWQWTPVTDVWVERKEGVTIGHAFTERTPGFTQGGRRMGGISFYDNDRGVSPLSQLRELLTEAGVKIEIGDAPYPVGDLDLWVAVPYRTRRESPDGSKPAAPKNSEDENDYVVGSALYVMKGAPVFPEDFYGFAHYSEQTEKPGF